MNIVTIYSNHLEIITHRDNFKCNYFNINSKNLPIKNKRLRGKLRNT